MNTTLKSLLLAGLMGLGQPALAQTGDSPPAYDVRGVVMGMTPDVADAHFRELGWEIIDEKAFIIQDTGEEFVASRTYAVTDRSENQDQVELDFSRPPVSPHVIRLFRTYKPYPADFMIQPKLLPLDQMESSVLGKYGTAQYRETRTAGEIYRWSSDPDATRCAAYTNGHFRIVPNSGRAPVPDCHGEHLSVTLQFQRQNIGPTLSKATFELVEVDEFRVDYMRFQSYLADIQTQKEREQTQGAEAPPL
ncbi:MAG: hypothetical protein MRY64_01870 [Hyphomonadaceae bacterium]|nr:hypothetical protein [Hyphomonadaceae bacterium]